LAAVTALALLGSACSDDGAANPDDDAGDETPSADAADQSDDEPAEAPTAADLQQCADIEPLGPTTTDADRADDPAGSSETDPSDVDPAALGVVVTYAANHPDSYAGHWIVRGDPPTIVVAVTGDGDATAEQLDATAPSADDESVLAVPEPPDDTRPLGERDDLDIVVVEATRTATELDEIRERIEGIEAAGTFPLRVTGRSVERNRIVVGIDDASALQADQLAAVLPLDSVCVS